MKLLDKGLLFFHLSPQIITFANYLKIKMSKAIIKTEKGDMTVEFYDNDAPNTVANFRKLAKSGFYDNVIFHRVIPNFMVQGGDPTGTGAGGAGYKIDCELTGGNQYHDRGVLSMAHAGRNTGSSQFFICNAKTPWLDGLSHIIRSASIMFQANTSCSGR